MTSKVQFTDHEQAWLMNNVVPLLGDIMDFYKEGEHSSPSGLTPAQAHRLMMKILSLPANAWAKHDFEATYGPEILSGK